ncbi:receptor-like protein 12 [Cucurbita maxima]|uniref:Receptor-like protein 12 n=1 Tax=Cucurbita maxima TaxID=3661 RepID=A0A6J1J7J1_CUCMA|nr:receptor-like protein 12 [Cucurbita maxima]
MDLSSNRFVGPIPSLSLLKDLTVLKLARNGFNGSMLSTEWEELSNLVNLDLRNNSLTGNVPLSLFHLPAIHKIQLSYNQFTGSLNELADVSSFLLNTLDLESNQLGGPFPSSFFELRGLKIPSLSFNNFTGKLNLDMFKQLNNITSSSFPQMTTLKLASSGFEGSPNDLSSRLYLLDLHSNVFEGPLSVFPPSASYLDFSNNSFSSVIPPAVGNYLASTVFLSLSRNSFEGSIPESICNATSLQVLDLSSNNLRGMFPQCLTQRTDNLVVLNLRGNALNGSIPNTFPVTCSLRTLDLSGNSIEGELPKSLSNCRHLEVLDIGNNQIQDIFPCPLKNISTLRVLVLRSNKFHGRFGCQESNGSWESLQIVDISRNNFNGSISGKSIVKWKAMVNEEDYSKSRAIHLRFSFFKFSSVNYQDTVTITSKGLDVELQKTLTVYTSIDFSCNSFDGQIPIEVGQLRLVLKDLQTIFLPVSIFLTFIPTYLKGHSRFSSVIPPAVGNYLASTVFLSLSRNSFEGSIPESICNATSLQVLDLSSNNLRGMFPQCLTQRTDNLVVLNLRGNALNGSIPNTFPVTCSLRTLDLSGNSIEGELPKSLSNCRHLEVLDIGNNQIQDIFPCPLKNISTLRVLVLRSNKFHGRFGCQESNGSWESLQIVDISRNNFNGSISGKSIVKWKAMVNEEDYSKSRAIHLRFSFFKFSSVNYQDTVTITSKGLDVELQKTLTVYTSIDFSCNSFDGQIPIEVGQLRALYVLNLSHNSLSGEIPSSIENLSQLGSLDLSSNRLSGTIPSQLAKLSFLGVLNLSYNLLVGMIPNGPQIQTFSPDSFVGNEGLCGSPLPKECKTDIRPSSDTRTSGGVSENEFEWKYIIITFGFISGAITGAIAGVWVWEKRSDTLMRWASALGFRIKKRV